MKEKNMTGVVEKKEPWEGAGGKGRRERMFSVVDAEEILIRKIFRRYLMKTANRWSKYYGK